MQKKIDRTSRHTQAGIGHSAPVHRGGHVQNRIRRKQALRGKTGAKSDPVRRQSNHAWTEDQAGKRKRTNIGVVGAGGCTPQARHQAGTLALRSIACRDKFQTLQLHAPRGHTAQDSGRVEKERDNTSRGSNNGDTTGRKRR